MIHDHQFTQYNLQALLFVARLAADGQHAAVKRFGLRPDQAQRILDCSLVELQEMVSAVQTHLVTPTFDPEALDQGFKLLERRRAEQALVLRLIRAGATSALLREYLGLNSSQIALFREHYGPAKTAGRPSKSTPADQYAVWTLWQESPQWADLSSYPERLLRIHERSGVLIRTISVLIRYWEAGGEPPEQPSLPDSQEGRPS